MSDFIFLRDPCRCPSCGKKGAARKNGFCGNCNTRLFSTVGDFHQMERNGLLPHYWAFTQEHGWKHRDHFIIATAKPQPRAAKLPDVPKHYGMHTTPHQVSRRGGKARRSVTAHP